MCLTQVAVSCSHVTAPLIFYCFRCVMALIRGINSHFPCPVCLVPAEKLFDLSITFPLRTTETMRAVYETANEAGSVADKEAILKEYGLRDVKV